MIFERIDQIEDALTGGRLDLRGLYEIWERREPVPDPLAKKPGNATPSAEAQLGWMQWKAALLPRFTAQALAAAEYLLVCDAAREALWMESRARAEDRPYFLRLRLDYARALSRLGNGDEARAQLASFSDPSIGRTLRAEGLELVGDLAWERARQQPSKAAQAQVLEEAREAYGATVSLDGTRLAAHIRSAAVAMMLGATDEAVAAAEDALRLASAREDEQGASFATSAARANALVLLGRHEEATQAFSSLKDAPDATTTRLADARYEAGWLAEAVGSSAASFRAAFPPLQLLIFAGHVPDRTAEQNRFPKDQISTVRAAIRATLDRLDARAGFSAAAAGGDLLFLEELRARNGVTHVVLPWSRAEFLRTSVLPFDSPDAGEKLWEPIFERALDEAASVRELGQMYQPESEVGLRYTTEVSAGIALLTARAARLDVQPVALWDGRDGFAGGTADFVGFWRTRLGCEPVIIPLSSDDERRAGPVEIRGVLPTERSIVRQEVKTMLFADIVGYSKLTEHVIPEFIGHFLRRVAQLAASSRHAPLTVNTWGDAIYAVFDFARDAGCFALEVVQMIRDHEADWLRLGLFWESAGADGPVKHPLNIRVGLHAGPTFLYYDSVVSRLSYTGSQVSRAARIEPIARPGEVYASEEFAALVELAREAERRSPQGLATEGGFTCEYAGSMKLAKDYPGRFRIYRLLPRIELHLEPLARAVHERYCAAGVARGDTVATHPHLRPWEELSEDARDSNRAQVADIPQKLRHLGFKLSSLHGLDPKSVSIPATQLEALAIREHDRWARERQREGWTYGPVRDNARKHHPLLVPWEALNETEREKDREAVRNALRLVAEGGFRLVAI